MAFQPVYGFASGDPLRFKRAVGRKDLFYIDDKEVDLKDVSVILILLVFLPPLGFFIIVFTFFSDQVIEAPLPKAPLEAAVMVHWLAIEGVQPAIPENAVVEGKNYFSVKLFPRSMEFYIPLIA